MRRIVLGIWMIALMAAVGFAQTQLRPPGAPLASDRAAGTAPEGAAAVTENPAPEASAKISFLELLTRGGWAMWPLAVCSLLGLALVIERGLALRRSQIVPAGFIAELKKIYRGTGDAKAAIAYCRRSPSSIGRIMAVAIRKMPEGTAVTEQAIADQGATEIARLRRNLRMLHGIAAITPTLGLLGTVTGMIRAFEAASRVGLGHSEALTRGIYEALVATMSGLMIAVPVLFFYYMYLGIIDRTILELNDTCQAFLDEHERGPASLERESVTSSGSDIRDKVVG